MATSHSLDRHDPALANLEILRQRLREALYAKKLRLRELAELCKRQRAELRAWVKERRAYALAELQNELRAARGAAQANRRARLQEARRSSTSAVELARAAVEIEHAHAAEQRRITRTHETKRVAVDKAHARSLSENAMSPATLKRLAPLLDKARGIRPAPGESRTEALWRYARAHPEEMHALLEPEAEKTIAKTRQEILAAEEVNVRENPSVADLEQDEGAHWRGKLPEELPGIEDLVLGRSGLLPRTLWVEFYASTGHGKDRSQRLVEGAARGGRTWVLARPRLDEGQRVQVTAVDLKVEILAESRDQSEALGQRRPPLEPDVGPRLGERPKRVGDPVVLLHKRLSEPTLAGDDAEKVHEVAGVMGEAHELCA